MFAGSDSVLTHQFTSPGTYHVLLEVMDDAGEYASKTMVYIVHPSREIAVYLWDFGDRTYSDLAAPEKTYAAGTFQVVLEVWDYYGGYARRSMYFPVYPSRAIASCFWQFGDGTTSALIAPSHTYSPGVYTVALTVYDNYDATAYRRMTYWIQAGANSRIVSYYWRFGDGGTGYGKKISHIYYIGGIQVVTLLLTDFWGRVSVAQATVQIFVYGFAATPRIGRQPLTVQFVFYGDPDDNISEFYWNFGDGNRAYSEEPTNIYHQTGLYDVSLRINTDDGYRTVTIEKFIHVLPGGVVVSRTNKAFRHAITPQQGVGIIEMPTDYFPMPEARTGTMALYDANNQLRGLVLDSNDGMYYDITTRNGPEDSGLSRVWKNKVGTDGEGGYDFDRSLTFGEDIGSFEHFFLRMIETHLYLRPFEESNRSEDGYDSGGFPDGFEIDLEFMVDGNPSPTTTIKNIPMTGDLKSDKKVEGHRVQLKITANRGDHLLVQRQINYVASNRAASPENRIMSEMDYQEELGAVVMWPSYYNGTLIDRVTSAALSLDADAVTGPEGGSGSALEFDSAITLPSVVLTGAGALLVWIDGTAAITIGGVAVSLTEHDESGDWKLYYASSLTASGAVVVTPTGTVKMADMRIFNSAVSSNSRTYYFNDVDGNNGNIVMP